MKKVFLVVFAISIFSAGSVFAVPFSTTFSGISDDEPYVDLFYNEVKSFDFSILDQFNPETQDVLSAKVSFDLWSDEPDGETVELFAGFYDDDASQWYYLNGTWLLGNTGATATLEINLGNLDLTQNGSFSSFVFMPRFGGTENSDYSIRIQNITFSGEVSAPEASAPVPEPSTILLFGAGLAGLIGYSRKRSNKKA